MNELMILILLVANAFGWYYIVKMQKELKRLRESELCSYKVAEAHQKVLDNLTKGQENSIKALQAYGDALGGQMKIMELFAKMCEDYEDENGV